MKNHLAHTDLKIEKLIKKLEEDTDPVGFDVEFVGGLMRGQNFTNISHACLLGFSVAFTDGDAFYVPLRHKGTNASFHHTRLVVDLLREKDVWAHNAKSEYYGLWMEGWDLPYMQDSMVAAWLVEQRNHHLSLEALGEKGIPYDPMIAFRPAQEVLDYVCQDARGTLNLGRKYTENLDAAWFREECKFVKLLADMKWRGISISRPVLRGTSYFAENELEKLKKDWQELAGDVSISSSKQLQDFFWDGTWDDTRKKTRSGLYSTDSETMQWLAENARTEAGRKLASLRLQYQEVAKIVGTYTRGLVELADEWRDGNLHPDLHHFGTVTGRLSSANPNIQNQPSHGTWATKIKSAYVPSPGCLFTSADYSQIELRLFSQYCKGPLLQAFVDGKDLHQVTADVLGVERRLGKTVNFGFLLYGGGPNKLARLLGVSVEEAKEKLALLAEGYPEIEEWRANVIDTVKDRERPWAMTMAGRKREFWELRPEEWEKVDKEGYVQAARAIAKKYDISSKSRVNSALESRGRRLVVNYLIQGGSRDLLVVGMNYLQGRMPDGWRVVTTVHDEVLIEHPEDSGEAARSLLEDCLCGAGEYFGLRVPIVAEAKTGKNWAEVK